MRKTALFASTLVLGLAGTAAADHWATDGSYHADCNDASHLAAAGSYDPAYDDDSTYYDDSTYPTTASYGDWVVPATPIPAPQTVAVRARAGFVWVEGYWRWTGYDWTWISGHWVRERPNYLYVQGRWELNRGRHRWVSGYWQPRTRVIIRDHHVRHHNARDRWDHRDRDRDRRWDRRDDRRADRRGRIERRDHRRAGWR
jgi:hypothetical protein